MFLQYNPVFRIRQQLSTTNAPGYYKTMPFPHDSDPSTAEYYDSHAAETYRLYTSAPSPYGKTFSRVFGKGGRVLDTGSGSGRDVNALLELGFDACGMDASARLIGLSARNRENRDARFLTGSLPGNIPGAFNRDSSWDGIVCSAVLQHIPDRVLPDTVRTFHRLLRDGGRVFITFPLEYVLETEDRDSKGRLFRIRPKNEYSVLFEQTGFQLIEEHERPDSLGREGIRWTEMVFEKRGCP